jgi:tetratricopeptide (TPR) repeat protein
VHGARVFEFPWIDHFAAARNACLEHARGEWIFWLDCDDRLDEANREKLRGLLASLPEANVAYSMKCRCLPAPGQDGDTIVDHVRLFKNDPRVRWKYRIHEQILGAVKASGGEVLFADVVITHTGYADPALRGRKLARDLRLLEMEYAEQPHDPFTLFNLGMVCLELRQLERAFALLEDSLNRSHPTDSIVRKLFVLLSNCRTHQNKPAEALRICLRGLEVCPDDAELLFLEGVLRAESGDLHGAHAALVRLLNTRPGQHFTSVVAGLRGHRGLHQLALVCARLGQAQEAERLWRQALQEAPRSVPALAEFANLLLNQGRRPEAEGLLARLEALPPSGPQLAARLRAR